MRQHRRPRPAGSEDQLRNDLKIDSGHGDTQNPSAVIVGRVGIDTTNDVHMTETEGALNLLIAQSAFGNVRLSVREHSTQGDDLNLILPYASDTIAPTQNRNAILVDYAGVRERQARHSRLRPRCDGVTNQPGINAAGWILLRVGDNVTFGGLSTANYPDANLSSSSNKLTDAQRIALNTKVVAGAWIDVHGDYDIYSPFPNGGGQLDNGLGTVMHLHGTIKPGKLSQTCADGSSPAASATSRGSSATSTPTRSSSTRRSSAAARASSARSRRPARRADATARVTSDAPKAADGEDFIVVNQLQTMYVPGTPEMVDGDVSRPHAHAGRPGRHRHVRDQHDRQPAVLPG